MQPPFGLEIVAGRASDSQRCIESWWASGFGDMRLVLTHPRLKQNPSEAPMLYPALRTDGRGWEKTLTNLIILTNPNVPTNPKPSEAFRSCCISGIYTSASIAPQESTAPRPRHDETNETENERNQREKTFAMALQQRRP